MKKTIFLAIIFCISLVVNAQQTYSGTFTVGGNYNYYYPVRFNVVGVDSLSSLGKIILYRPDAHENGTWSGAFHSEIEFISSCYGHMSTKLVSFTYINGDICDVGCFSGNSGKSPYVDPIIGIEDGSTNGFGNELDIWLKGGATYHWSSDANSKVTLINGNPGGT